jgi:hypothetical protein
MYNLYIIICVVRLVCKDIRVPCLYGGSLAWSKLSTTLCVLVVNVQRNKEVEINSIRLSIHPFAASIG